MNLDVATEDGTEELLRPPLLHAPRHDNGLPLPAVAYVERIASALRRNRIRMDYKIRSSKGARDR
jgi:hypothetical protein